MDFYCHHVNLAIEVDGSVHDNNKELDTFRQNEIMAKSGASFLRFTNEDVINNLEEVKKNISRLVMALRKRS